MAYRIDNTCTGCASCAGSCPVGAISKGKLFYEINPDICIDCGCCAAVCPVGAPKCI